MSDSQHKYEKAIDRFDDMYHQYGDDKDIEYDRDIDFDNAFTTNRDNDIENELEQEIDFPILNEIITAEDEQLSQKLSQLSASEKEQEDYRDSSTTKKRPALTTTTMSKRIKSNDIQMPKYLSKEEKKFEHMIYSLPENIRETFHIEELRQIALCIHKIECLRLDKLLWTTYLRSGTGTLIESQKSLLLWPKEVKSKMITQGDPDDMNHEMCLNYVKNVLQKFDDEIISYETMLSERKENVQLYWTSEIEDSIEKFVEQFISIHVRLPQEARIAIVEYDYKDRLFQLEFYSLKPVAYQKEVFEKLTQTKIDKETARCEVALLKQRLAHNHLPKAFDLLAIPPPISINSIHHDNTRQYLMERCEKILQRTKSDMMLVYTTTAEHILSEKEKIFENNMISMKRRQQNDSLDEKLTQKMMDILEKRFKNINERLLCLYKLKIRFFVSAPTIKN